MWRAHAKGILKIKEGAKMMKGKRQRGKG